MGRYKFPIILILTGVLIIFAVIKLDQGHPLSFIPFILGALLILVGLKMTEQISSAHTLEEYPDFHKELVDVPILHKVISGLLYGQYILMMWAIALIGNIPENTIYSMRLFLKYGLLGFVAGMVLLEILRLVMPKYDVKNESRQFTLLALVIGSAAWLVIGMYFYNSKTAKQNLYTNEYEVLDVSNYSTSNDKYLFLQINEKERRFVPSRKEMKELEVGQCLKVIMGKGALGYEQIFYFGEIRKLK